MEDSEVKISRKQARIFAYAIYRDVAAYVASHQEEYQKFIKSEDDSDGKNTTAHRPKRGRREANGT